MKRYYLAIDIGASSGRHILGSLENGKYVLEEVFRFPNGAAQRGEHLCWDYETLFENIVAGACQMQGNRKNPRSCGH